MSNETKYSTESLLTDDRVVRLKLVILLSSARGT